MNFLESFYNSPNIDNTKHTCHSYIKEYYDPLFSNKPNKNIKLLEIGVRDGSSLQIWNNWFIKSEIYGLDIISYNSVNNNIFFNQINAYTQEALDLFENNFFDYIIDDGPHTPESQKFTIQNWMCKLKPEGKMIIEDIGCRDDNNNNLSSDESLDFLLKSIDTNISEYKVFDLRKIGQYDSIILEITKK